jgi:2-oxoglutarate dehydrogenase E2 component (dihydrolipoamide succinyltransferase)
MKMLAMVLAAAFTTFSGPGFAGAPARHVLAAAQQAPAAPAQAPGAPAPAPAPSPTAKPGAPMGKPASETVRFEAIDIFVDAGEQPLSAYQFELTTPVREGWRATIVGVEGGEHPAFKAAPFYDPQALQSNRIIIAAFTIDDALPTGRTRVARLHMELRRDPAAPPMSAAETARADAPASAAPSPGGLSAQEQARQAKSNVAITRDAPARHPIGGYAISLVTAASREGTATSASIAIEAAPAPSTAPAKSPGGTP